jgi:hypothetical protein
MCSTLCSNSYSPTGVVLQPTDVSNCVCAGVLIGLIGEWTTGLGLMQQTADHPITVFAIFLLITFASYIPIAR